jgi:hypothetical protein
MIPSEDDGQPGSYRFRPAISNDNRSKGLIHEARRGSKQRRILLTPSDLFRAIIPSSYSDLFRSKGCRNKGVVPRANPIAARREKIGNNLAGWGKKVQSAAPQ